jgi:hypothetical protein
VHERGLPAPPSRSNKSGRNFSVRFDNCAVHDEQDQFVPLYPGPPPVMSALQAFGRKGRRIGHVPIVVISGAGGRGEVLTGTQAEARIS